MESKKEIYDLIPQEYYPKTILIESKEKRDVLIGKIVGMFKESENTKYDYYILRFTKDFNYDEKYRPVHGIHISLNRQPTGSLGWGMDNWKNQWNEFRNSKEFKDLEPTLTKMIKEKIQIIEDFYNNDGEFKL